MPARPRLSFHALHLWKCEVSCAKCKRRTKALLSFFFDVWAVGEGAGSPHFTHIAFDDFHIVRDNIFGGQGVTTGRHVRPFKKTLRSDCPTEPIELSDGCISADKIGHRMQGPDQRAIDQSPNFDVHSPEGPGTIVPVAGGWGRRTFAWTNLAGGFATCHPGSFEWGPALSLPISRRLIE